MANATLNPINWILTANICNTIPGKNSKAFHLKSNNRIMISSSVYFTPFTSCWKLHLQYTQLFAVCGEYVEPGSGQFVYRLFFLFFAWFDLPTFVHFELLSHCRTPYTWKHLRHFRLDEPEVRLVDRCFFSQSVKSKTFFRIMIACKIRLKHHSATSVIFFNKLSDVTARIKHFGLVWANQGRRDTLQWHSYPHQYLWLIFGFAALVSI